MAVTASTYTNPYAEALGFAGAEVLYFRAADDYQGTWVSLVVFGGKIGWVSGEFGSCSGYDGLEAIYRPCGNRGPGLLALAGVAREEATYREEASRVVSRDLRYLQTTAELCEDLFHSEWNAWDLNRDEFIADIMKSGILLMATLAETAFDLSAITEGDSPGSTDPLTLW